MLRQAIRSLASTRLVTAAGVVTLAVALGACTGVFAVVYGLLFAPLPYRHASSLVVISGSTVFAGQSHSATYSLVELSGWQDNPGVFDSVAASAGTTVTMATDTALQSVEAAYVSGPFFRTMDAPFVAGAPFDATREAGPVAVISARLWAERFGSRPDAIGQSIAIDGARCTVVGVLPAAFRYPDRRTDIWVPAAFGVARGNASWIAYSRGGGFTFVARIHDGVSMGAAARATSAIAARQATLFPDNSRGRTPSIVPIADSVTGGVKPILRLVAATVMLLLLVACVNVANLLFARHVGRRRDFAVQRALGAGRWRLVAASLVEAGLLVMAAGAIGLVLAGWIAGAVRAAEPAWLPRTDAIAIGAPVWVFALALCGVVTLGCALVPAWRASSGDVSAALRAGGMLEHQTRRSRFVHDALAALEIAASVVLLVGALLLMRSFVRLAGGDIGAVTHNQLVAQLDLQGGRTLTPARRAELADALVARASAVSGVTTAGIGTSLPPDAARGRYTLRGVETPSGIRDVAVDGVAVTPGFFGVLGVRLESGRLFDKHDTATAPPVAILSEATARRVFGSRDPVGLSLTLPGPRGGAPVQIVGVVSNVKYEGMDKPADGGIYRPFAQQPLGVVFLVVTESGASAVTEAIRRAVAGADPQIVVYDMSPLQDRVSRAVAAPQFRAFVVGAFAVMALVLAMAGVFGVISYSVVLRTAEIGLRSAIGATPAAILRLVMGEACVVATTGAIVGTVVAAVAMRGLSSLLFGVTTGDLPSYVAPVMAVIALTLAAAYVPARRASRVDVVAALRLR